MSFTEITEQIRFFVVGKSPEFFKIPKKEKTQLRPPTEHEVDAKIRDLTRGKYGYLSVEDMGKWREYYDPKKKVTTFVYKGYDLGPNRKFDMPWIKVEDSD